VRNGYKAFCGVDVAGDAVGLAGVCGAILRALRGAGGGVLAAHRASQRGL